MADSITAVNTMNPGDLYHDPSLDNLYTSGSRYLPIAAGPERRRRMPPAPEVPRGPPIAYRGGNGPRRSFSQRAKARPPMLQPTAVCGQNERQKPQDTGSYSQHLHPLLHPPLHPLLHQLLHSLLHPLLRPPLHPLLHLLLHQPSRRDWTPDRSPLQKLEVTLNDISKEEKRARVQEAEMRLRESKTQRAVRGFEDLSEPPRPAESKQSARLADSARDATARSQWRAEPAERHQRHQQYQLHPLHQPSSAAQQPVPAHAGAPGVAVSATRAAPPHDYQANSAYRDEPGDVPASLVERQRNASHKATLAKLTGVGAVGAVGAVATARSMSSKQQAAPWPDVEYARPGPGHMAPSAIDSRHQLAVDGSAQAKHDSRGLVGLGLTPTAAPPPPPTANAFAVSARPAADQAQQKQHRPSVSFKEPAVGASVDEWTRAKTARLSVADFALDTGADGAGQNQAWWEADGDSKSRRRAKAGASFGLVGDPVDERTAEFNPPLYLRCGPLLRYTGMKRTTAAKVECEIWRGSVMIVTQDSRSSYREPPVLRLFSRPKSLLPPPPAVVSAGELAPEYVDPIAGLEKVSRTGRALYVRPVDHLEEGKDLSHIETDDGLFESSPSLLDTNGSQGMTTAAHNRRTSGRDGEHVGRYREVPGARLYVDARRDVTFWRFNVEIELADTQQHIAYRINRGASSSFWVPARGETMNMVFHSCNGFSTSVNPDLFSGPDPLWRDVLNVHQTRPFHVMIGGGDQIYNDCVKSDTEHFASWIRLRNPHHKHAAPFTAEMREELETFYLDRYALCFSRGLFAMAASQIPMVNVWDDHDIIDGFGSYPDHFMQSAVFSGLGNVAFKYYMLFQHQSVPEETAATEPSWVLGAEPGPYIRQPSRSLFMHMGRRVAFLGVDCRTERMRDEVLSVRSLDILLEQCRKGIVEGDTKHLIVLLGVPIAYPRLVWLENVLTSRAMDPVKALGRAGLLKGGFLNNFDGGVEILDDLDDHWTASHHKAERNDLISDLQDLAAEKSVRITILGGDVHLAAVGQFYSNPRLRIAKDKDHRYMPNVISSAIVNSPPPSMLADVINKRNKTHHLNAYTDEDMIPIFTHDVDHKKRNNCHLLPRRNWCSIREYTPGATPPPSLPTTPSVASDDDDDDIASDDWDQQQHHLPKRRFSLTKQAVNPAGLLRRLSTRKPPPSSYPDTMVPAPAPAQPLKSASYDGSQPGRAGSFFAAAGSAASRPSQPSLDSQEPQRRAASLDNGTSRPAQRPAILRRPTNLSAKAARKGNVPAVDADGNEIDVNEHINLDGGLDIVINAEVDQKDPAGITIPYRLLVPALWYDGSSDREKLKSTAGVARTPSLLQRIGLAGHRSQKLARSQGAGNWGQEMSDAESVATQTLPQYHVSAPLSHAEQRAYDTRQLQPRDLTAASAPVPASPAVHAPAQRMLAAGYRQSPRQTSKAVQRAYETGQLQPPTAQTLTTQTQTLTTQTPQTQTPTAQTQTLTSQTATQSDMLYDTGNRPPSQHLTQPARQTSAAVQRAYETGQLQAPIEHDVLYDTANRPPSQHLAQRPRTATAGRRSLTITAFKDRDPAIPQRTLSKQERILGLGAGNPQPLRGNEFTGGSGPPAGGAGAYAGEPVPRGYSGIDAYREPSRLKRGFSLKKARDWLDGKRVAREYESGEWSDGEAGGHIRLDTSATSATAHRLSAPSHAGCIPAAVPAASHRKQTADSTTTRNRFLNPSRSHHSQNQINKMKFTFTLASLVALAVAEPWATTGWGSWVTSSGAAINATSATSTIASGISYSVPYSSGVVASGSFATSSANSTSSTSKKTSSAAASSTFSGAAYANKEFGGAALAVGALALLL
ncbi:hypothetical protein DV737_g1529, partial [Chaetothyriales sp. CBS 132003]